MEKKQSITELAFEILEKKGNPLHYKDITKLIMQKRRIKGKTPWKTVNSRLSTNSKFRRVGKGKRGIYGLAEWKAKV